MSKYDEFRANAEECERMARATIKPLEKATWLEMAEVWRRMIREAERTASENSTTDRRDDGTGQIRSDGQD